MCLQNWLVDYRGKDRANIFFLAETIVAATSPYQEILIVDTPAFGRVLFLDGVQQSSALDEHIYHEALVHPALIAHHSPKKVFIAGGGEGAVLREVLKHPNVEKVVMVDIDEVLVELAKKHLTNWHKGAFDDRRVQVIHEDARAYLARTEDVYDCIILDISDPVADGPASLLFTTEFFQLVKSRMAEKGTFVMQAEATSVGSGYAHISIIKTLKQSFASVLPYQLAMASYNCCWGFALASDDASLSRFSPQKVEKTLHSRNCNDLYYYDAQTHQHMFSLPKYLRQALDNPDCGMIIRDDRVLVVGKRMQNYCFASM